MTDTGGATPPSITTVAIRHDKAWRWGDSTTVPGIVVHEDGIPEEPESPGYSPTMPPNHLELAAVPPVPSPRKSPVTVQEWVDSLPHPPPPGSPITGRRRTESDSELLSTEADLSTSEVVDSSTTDTLVLGAEAGHLSPSRTPSIVVDGPTTASITPPLSPRLAGLMSPRSKLTENAEIISSEVAAVVDRRQQFNRARTTERMASFASDSAASNASSAGVESFLESRKLDPEKILLNLGFGGSQDSNGDLGLSRIPQRFLQPSQVKGISISQFYRHEMNLAETFETGYYGYRGLTGPNHTPSPIVAKIMERLRYRDRDSSVIDGHSVASAPAATTTVLSEPVPEPPKLTPQQRFANAAQKVQQSKSVLTRIQSWKSSNQQPTGSVLNPDNRLFLKTQAQSKSPDVPRRRIIMGHRSYTFSGDGDLIECNQDKKDTSIESIPQPLSLPSEPTIEIKRPKPPLVHKDSLLSSNTSFSEESDESEDEYKRKFTKRYSRQNISPKRNINNENNNNNEEEENNIDNESESTPELTSTPIKPNPIINNPTLQRHLSFNKRLSSTSLSSWESENWLPSPPLEKNINKLSYNTFSSIEEVDNDDVLKRTDSSDSDLLNMKVLPSTSIDIKNESQTSGRGSVASDIVDNSTELIRKASTASTRRGSLKRQSRVSSIDEDNWREMTENLNPTFLSPKSTSEFDNSVPGSSFHSPDMSGIVEEEASAAVASVQGLSRSGSAQSDSSGFQEGEAAAAANQAQAAASTQPETSQQETKPKEEMTPANALKLEQLQQQMVRVAGGLQSFRADILAESNPEIQAKIQLKVDQISGVLLHLQSLCEDLQGGSQTEDQHS